MALQYDSQALRVAVERLFITLSQTHPDSDIAGLESTIIASKVHEHNNLKEALDFSTQKTEGIKPRVVILSNATRKSDGLPVFYVRKGRENRDNSVQIGRTWELETLRSLDVPPENAKILILGFKKPYYWMFASPAMRQDFESKLRQVASKYLKKELPSLLSPSVLDVAWKRAVVNPTRQAPQQIPQQAFRPNIQILPQHLPKSASQNVPHKIHFQNITQGEVKADQVIPQRPTPQSSTSHRPVAKDSMKSVSVSSTAPGHALPQTPMKGSEGLASSQMQFPVPPPHAANPPAASSSVPVEPLRSFNKNSSPQIPQRAPTRSLRPKRNQATRQETQHRSSLEGSTSISSLGSSHLETGSRYLSPLDQDPSRSPSAASQPLSPTSNPADAEMPVPQAEVQLLNLDFKTLPPSVTFDTKSSSMEADSPERRKSSQPLFTSQALPLKSPTNNNLLRGRSPSITPLVLSGSPENRRLQDLLSVIDELKWEGTDISELEGEIKSRLNQLSYQNFSGIVDLDNQFDDLNVYVKSCADELNRVDAKLRAVAMNLVGNRDDVTSMDGQSDGLQILTLNYKKLATEIEKLLDVSRLDDQFVMELSSVKFGDPSDPRTPDRILHIEELLVDLNQALELFTHRADAGDSGSTTMEAFQEPKRKAQSLALNFGKRYKKFVGHEFQRIFSSPTAMDATISQGLEYKLFVNLYMFSRCLLFIRESVPSLYREILQIYEKQAQPVYRAELSKYMRSWSSNIESIASQHRKTRLATDGRQALGLGDNQALPGELAKQTQLNMLSESGTRHLHSAITNGVNNFCSRIASQQCFLEKYFHLGSDGGQKFTSFSTQGPLRLRQIKDEVMVHAAFEEMTYLDINFSKTEMWSVKEIMQERIFPRVDDILYRELAKLVNLAPFQTIYLIMILDIRSYELRLTNQQFLTALLGKIHKQVSDNWEEILRHQTRQILSAQFTTKKRVGVHPVVALFTEHVSIIESSVAAALDTESTRRQRISVRTLSRVTYWGDTTRQMVDRCYENMFRAIAQGLRMGAAASEIQGSSSGINAATRLKAAARETTGSVPVSGEETKELLNRHVVMIENLYRIHRDLEKFKSAGLQSILHDAKLNYQRELDGYIADVISRPVGKIVAFVKQHESRSMHPVKQKESISALKRISKGYDLKELRVGIEQLHKRVEKHFSGSDPEIFALVWQAIRAEYIELFTKLNRIAHNLDAFTYIEFQVADVKSAFN